jgi:hypothetical protein
MHISFLHVLFTFGIVLVVAAVIWLLKIVFRREQYTRERYAFVALTGLLALGTTVISSLADKETPWESVMNVGKSALGLAPTAEPPRIADHILMLLALIIISAVVIRFYESWPGAISVRHHEKDKYREPAPLLAEGLFEAKRILGGKPPLAVHTPSRTQDLTSVLEPPQASLAWHIQARDLLSLRSPSYVIDRNNDWHEQERCWIGTNRKSLTMVAIRCDVQEISHNQTVRFIEYVSRIARQRGAAIENAEFVVAIRNLVSGEDRQILGHNVRLETESTLLDGLVDFADYYSEIRRRVERQSLPDSSLTISEVYTPSSCRDEEGIIHPNVEAYLHAWLLEPGQRQLALLGEYGQGKSTSALMTAYNIIKPGLPTKRIPILIELRGKSPRNMTPEELLAGWAFPYRIDPFAVMKLLMAGRVFLILEGFDEMALVGDSEARLSHFRTLWKFCHQDSKILITGRPNFFLDDHEMRAGLGIANLAGVSPYCEALHLEPFTVDQIRSALRSSSSQTSDEIVALAESDAKFREIVSRGSLLYVVSQLWVREELSKRASRISSAFVMDLFIQHSYRRQTQKAVNSPEFMILNEGERRYFMNGIASYMGALELPNQITKEQFKSAVRTLYEAIPESVSRESTGLPKSVVKPLRQRLSEVEDPVEEVANDVRSSGILVVDQSKSGALRFAHKSFLEYLMAKVYGDYITKKNREASTTIVSESHLKARHLLDHAETLSFLAEIFLDSLKDDDVKNTSPVSKRLFDLIVVQNSRILSFARLSSMIALNGLALRARLNAARDRQLSPFRRILIWQYLLLRGQPGFIIASVALFSWPLYMGFVSGLLASTHFEHVRLVLFPCLCAIAFFQSIWMSSNPRQSAVRMWFICCVTGGLSLRDIALSTGPDAVIPIAVYLRVLDRLRQ